MTKNKFKRKKSGIRKLKRKLVELSNIEPVRISKAQKGFEYQLTPSDSLMCVYAVDENDVPTEVVTVCLNIEVNGKPITIAWLDSEHGHLHMHLRNSLEDESYTVTLISESGTPKEWLTEANSFIRKNYVKIKNEFLKRSNLPEYY
jgi:hypothetical protein